MYDTLEVFQSTFPLQGTTIRFLYMAPKNNHFNPRSHCRERPLFPVPSPKISSFQSTFPLQGTTLRIQPHQVLHLYFNPRSHCRERRLRNSVQLESKYFNPRSHCRERRVKTPGPIIFRSNFNPRSHCRERLSVMLLPHVANAFQSTFPLQGTTANLSNF